MTLARIEQLLEDNLRLTEENNRLIREVRRNGKMAFWFKVALWAVIIILPFLLIGPILEALVPAVNGETGGVNLLGLPSSGQLQDVLDAYQGQLGE